LPSFPFVSNFRALHSAPYGCPWVFSFLVSLFFILKSNFPLSLNLPFRACPVRRVWTHIRAFFSTFLSPTPKRRDLLRSTLKSLYSPDSSFLFGVIGHRGCTARSYDIPLRLCKDSPFSPPAFVQPQKTPPHPSPSPLRLTLPIFRLTCVFPPSTDPPFTLALRSRGQTFLDPLSPFGASPFILTSSKRTPPSHCNRRYVSLFTQPFSSVPAMVQVSSEARLFNVSIFRMLLRRSKPSSSNIFPPPS